MLSTFRFSDGVLARLREVSYRSGISKTSLIERLVEKHLLAEAVIVAQERLENLNSTSSGESRSRPRQPKPA